MYKIGYLDQIIDDMAIFEVIKDDEVEGRLIVLYDKKYSYFVEGYYYNLTLGEEGDDRSPFLIPEANEWIYKNRAKEQKIYINTYDINIEKTIKARKEISEISRELRLRGAFFNEIHINIKQKVDDVDGWKIRFDAKEKDIYARGYEKYKKNINDNSLSRQAWEDAYKKSVEEIANGWQLSDENLSVLVDSKVSIYSISYFLNKYNPKRFVIYERDVFCLLKLLKIVEKSCSTRTLKKNIDAYREYNESILWFVSKIHNNGLKEKDDWFRLSYFFDKKFILYRFLWNNCIFPS